MTKWLDKYEQGGLILKKKTKDNYSLKGNANDSKVSVGPNFVGAGYDGYNWKSPAWGGQFAMGGSLPGSVGFMYARTQNPAPANGKYTKKTLASAQNGQEMKYWQDGLDFKPKSISKKGKKIIKDDMGQWAHPGEITEISSPDITMQGVDYPVLGISDTGDTQMMYPDQDYKFDGEKVTEYPMAQNGDWLKKYAMQPRTQESTRNVALEQAVKAGIDRQSNYLQNRPSISKWTPKPGEIERLEEQDRQRREENSGFLNRLAANPHVAKLQENVLLPMFDLYTLGEGAIATKQLAKEILKKAPKFALSKAATTVAEDKALKEVAQTISQPGVTQLFDKEGKEIGKNYSRTAAEMAKYNQSVYGPGAAFRTGATEEVPKGLEPYLTWDTEIDWGKWNPEIPKNEKLMQEYVNIENTAKNEGTWMKNYDGTPFAGTPEQFVQSRSENFKKAFPQGADITYRGDNEHYHELRPKSSQWYGQPIFTANENLARFYTAKGQKAGYFTPFEPTADERLQNYITKNFKPGTTKHELFEKHPMLIRGAMATDDAGVHQLAIPKTKNVLEIDAQGRDWGGIMDADIANKIRESGIELFQKDYPNLFSTDDVAQYIKKQGIDRAFIKNVDDGALGHVTIHNQQPGKYAKSLRGNNGMFDMTNPNIYKALIPAVGTAGLVGASQKENGGWLEKYQDGGTLLKNKVVGNKVTPLGNLDLRPTYAYFDTKYEDVYDPTCPDGVGCSKQATDNAQKITGLPRTAYAPADAAYRDAVAKRTGLINLFDQEGLEKTDANSRDAGWKFAKKEDFDKWKAGDIVTLDAGNDIYFGYDAPRGFSSSDNSGVTHNGVIVGFMDDGRPIIKHGYATGKNKGRSITEVLGKDNRVSDLGHGRYAIKSVWRPKEVDQSGNVSSIQPVIDKAEDRAARKQSTSSNESFYLKPTKEESLIKDLPVAANFSGANNRLDTKKQLVDLFNNKKLDKDLQYKLGITAQELNKLKPVVYGVFGQESNFNDIDSGAASLKEVIGNLFSNNSRGAAQIKMSSLTKEEKDILGIKKASDLDNNETAYKAALLMLNNSRKRMNQEIAEGTHPELADKDEYFRAGYYYNSPARAIQSSEKWTKKKNKKATKADINRNELRMDEGSYPYKLMERAKDLGVNVDFDATSELEPVVVTTVASNKKGTKFVPKQEKGGWLNKYK